MSRVFVSILLSSYLLVDGLIASKRLPNRGPTWRRPQTKAITARSQSAAVQRACPLGARNPRAP